VRHHSVGRSTFGGTTSEGGGYEEAVELFCFRARSSPSEPCGGSGFICVTVLLGGLVGRSTFGGTTSVRCEYGETDARSSPSEPCGESWSRKSEQSDKWSFCLTAGTLCPTNQERP
jgi:hypothetical protein